MGSRASTVTRKAAGANDGLRHTGCPADPCYRARMLAARIIRDASNSMADPGPGQSTTASRASGFRCRLSSSLIHLMIVLALVGLVLLQSSEGGGLGMGGGAASCRAAAPPTC